MKSLLVISGICIMAIAGLLAATMPTNVPSIVLTLPFVFAFVGIYAALSVIFRHRGMGRSQSMRVSGVFAGLPVGLLVLQSIGQLTLRDVATIFALFSLSYFYFIRSSTTE